MGYQFEGFILKFKCSTKYDDNLTVVQIKTWKDPLGLQVRLHKYIVQVYLGLHVEKNISKCTMNYMQWHSTNVACTISDRNF